VRDNLLASPQYETARKREEHQPTKGRLKVWFLDPSTALQPAQSASQPTPAIGPVLIAKGSSKLADKKSVPTSECASLSPPTAPLLAGGTAPTICEIRYRDRTPLERPMSYKCDMHPKGTLNK